MLRFRAWMAGGLLAVAALAAGGAVAAPGDYRVDEHGFVVGLDVPSAVEVVEGVQALRSHLFQRRRDARAQVEAGHIDAKRALLAIILPGGMLYTAVQKARARQARIELEHIDAEIATLDQDLTHLVMVSGADNLIARAAP